MKYKTLNNMKKTTQAIANKGYSWETANNIAIQFFDNSKQTGMSVEWYINRIVSKVEYERGSVNELHDIRKISR